MDTNNVLYDLMLQYTVESRSLWRMRDSYKKDAEADQDVTAFWEKSIAQKESQISEIKSLIAARL